MSLDNMVLDNPQTQKPRKIVRETPTTPQDLDLWDRFRKEFHLIVKEKMLVGSPHVTILTQDNPAHQNQLMAMGSNKSMGSMAFFSDDLNKILLRHLVDFVVDWPRRTSSYGPPYVDYKDYVFALPEFQMEIVNGQRHGHAIITWWYKKPQDLSSLMQKQLVIT